MVIENGVERSNKVIEMTETQASICEWADATFGEAPDIRRIFSRANEEAAELVTHTVMPEIDTEKIATECADIAIILCRAARACNTDIYECINFDMDVNGYVYGAAVTVVYQMGITLMYAGRNDIDYDVMRNLIGKTIFRLAEICAALGYKLSERIETKMARNRAREWRLDGSGHGYHTKEPEEIAAAKVGDALDRARQP